MTRSMRTLSCGRALAAALLVALTGFVWAEPPEKLDVYLLIGQSNMAGRALRLAEFALDGAPGRREELACNRFLIAGPALMLPVGRPICHPVTWRRR